MPAPHILIIGSGSAGKRHARNFAKLGCNISCVDPREDRRRELAAETPVVGAFASNEAAFAASSRPDAVVVASPPAFHVEQTLASLQHGLPVLLEKPSSPGLQGTQRMAAVARKTGVPILLGYTWRWWPPLEKVRQILASRQLGELLHVQFHMSAHLADWHPWERYQDFFMARRDLGGGALLDESHWIDLMLWFFGMPRSVFARIEKLSSLEIDADDNVDIIAMYEGRMRVALHLDLYGRPHEKSIRFVGEKGTMLWTADPNRIVIGRDPSGWSETHDFNCERNDMFVAVAREFLDSLTRKRGATCSIEDGERVLKLVEAARRSHARRAVVDID